MVRNRKLAQLHIRSPSRNRCACGTACEASREQALHSPNRNLNHIRRKLVLRNHKLALHIRRKLVLRNRKLALHIHRKLERLRNRKLVLHIRKHCACGTISTTGRELALHSQHHNPSRIRWKLAFRSRKRVPNNRKLAFRSRKRVPHNQHRSCCDRKFFRTGGPPKRPRC